MPARRSLRFARSIQGCMAAPAGRLREWLLGLGRDNAQREYFLTDVVAGAVHAGTARRGDSRGQCGGSHGRQRQDSACASRGGSAARARGSLDAGGRDAGGSIAHRHPRRRRGRPRRFHRRQCRADRQGAPGGGVKVGPNCVIANSSIGAGTEIFANSVIDHAIVAENCRIGPFARLRPGTDPAPRRAHRQFRRGQKHRDRGGQQGQSSDLPGRFARSAGM